MRTSHAILVPLLCALCATLAPAQTPDLTWEQVNEAFLVPIWADDNLWDDADEATATRLEWAPEGKTDKLFSARSYPDRAKPMLGAKAVTFGLYGEGAKVAEISIVFANKGSFVKTFIEMERISIPLDLRRKDRALEAAMRKAERPMREAIANDAVGIDAALTKLFGEPRGGRFLPGREMTDKPARWDWKGHAFILSAPKQEYVRLRILPASVADAEGKVDRVADRTFKDALRERVKRQENGDVIIRGIPMVQQGPMNYCVPATWERYLRYLGMRADMFAIAMSGLAPIGGGTVVADTARAVGEMALAAGRRLDKFPGRLGTREVAPAIDAGVPIIFAMLVDETVNSEVGSRTLQRKTATDWKKWADTIKETRRKSRKIKPPEGNAHAAMIIGYNPQTEEIAVSDSWGPEFEERWFTPEELQAISLNEALFLRW